MTTRRVRTPLPPRMLTQAEAAAYCGVSVNHFHANVPVPPVKIGEKKLWDRHALDRWLDRLDEGDYAVPGNDWDEVLR